MMMPGTAIDGNGNVFYLKVCLSVEIGSTRKSNRMRNAAAAAKVAEEEEEEKGAVFFFFSLFYFPPFLDVVRAIFLFEDNKLDLVPVLFSCLSLAVYFQSMSHYDQMITWVPSSTD